MTTNETPRASNMGRGGKPESHTTRAAMTWTAVVAALVVFILLIVFFIQNQDTVEVHFLGLTGPVPLGVALFIAAVAGGVLVAVAGAVRIIQLRAIARRAARPSPSEPAPPPGSTPPQDR
ncbi:LapA family protein [Sinomonas flava]|uniref:LapA family protein n=1 Tax=Sinomonas flava TaxID=496857 RepID=UPI0039A753B8